jgi:ferrous iron transport protein A
MKNTGEKCNLAQLQVGQKAIVLKIKEENKKIRRHLLDMGITRGVEIKIKKIAPMGDPIDLQLRDYELCIRKEDISKIEVEVI